MDQRRPTERLLRSLIDLSRAARAQSQGWNAAGDHGLSRNEVVALGLIADHEGCRASAVSERMNVGPSVVSRLVGSLADRGLLWRDSDPDDGRAEQLTVTEAGATALRAARTAYVEALDEHLRGWDADRIVAAADVLDELTAALVDREGR